MTSYQSVESLIARIDEPNRSACARLVADHRVLFATVQGSTHNHQRGAAATSIMSPRS